MSQLISAIQVIPQPRLPPKIFIWLMYTVILAGLIAIIATFNVAYRKKRFWYNENTFIDGSRVLPTHMINQTTYKKASILTLEDVIAYECLLEVFNKNITWLKGSDKEISYWDNLGEYMIMNIDTGYSYPNVNLVAKTLFFPWYYLMTPQRHIATLGKCDYNLNHHQCYFKVIMISSIIEKKYSSPNNYLISEFSQLVNNHPGMYNYINEDMETDEQFVHRKSKYIINIKNPQSNSTPSNFCVLKFFEENEFIWNSEGFLPKYIYSVLEACHNYTLEWKDEFILYPSNPYYELFKSILPTTFPVDSTMYIPPSTNDKHAIFQSDHDQYKKNRGNSHFDFMKIGRTDWYLHVIVDKNKVFQRSFLNLAVSNANTLMYDIRINNKNRDGLRWMPHASERYKPLMTDELYVTRILAVYSTDYNEAFGYFIAAPILDISKRLLYKLRIFYPSLNHQTKEVALCMTCSDRFQNRLIPLDEDSFNLSSRGKKPLCISSDVSMSNTGQYYILNCRGPQVPWTSIVSTRTNLVVHQLAGFERLRELSKSIQQPLLQQFLIKLDKDYWARVRIHLPSIWKPDPKYCKTKLRVLLRIANYQSDQLVTADYDLSLTTYIASLGHYAVLYVDVRASKLQTLDFTNLEFRWREIMQMQDYVTVVKHVLKDFACLDIETGIGVFGEAYGGHMALNLVAGQMDKTNDENQNLEEKNVFRCCAALRPFTDWQNYVYPFNMKPSIGFIGSIRKKAYERQYLSRLSRRLRNKHFTVIGSFSKDDSRYHYMNHLVKMFTYHGVNFEYQPYEDSTDCDSKIKFYQQVQKYFDHCFESYTNPDVI